MNKSSYYEFSNAGYTKRLALLKKFRDEALANIDNLHVSVSVENSKMGAIPSVSLLPVFDCGNCRMCSHGCYDLRHDCYTKETNASRARNSVLVEHAPERFWRELRAWITLHYPRAFRFHVGGDIKNADYLRNMCRLAEEFPDIKFLAFTKMFDVVNKEVDEGLVIPSNFHLVFSGWPGLVMHNPHHFSTSHPLFADGATTAPDGAKLCTGNCTECLRSEGGCWSLGPDEAVVFPAH